MVDDECCIRSMAVQILPISYIDHQHILYQKYKQYPQHNVKNFKVLNVPL